MPGFIHFERDGQTAVEREWAVPAKEALGWTRITPGKAEKVEAAQDSATNKGA